MSSDVGDGIYKCQNTYDFYRKWEMGLIFICYVAYKRKTVHGFDMKLFRSRKLQFRSHFFLSKNNKIDNIKYKILSVDKKYYSQQRESTMLSEPYYDFTASLTRYTKI